MCLLSSVVYNNTSVKRTETFALLDIPQDQEPHPLCSYVCICAWNIPYSWSLVLSSQGSHLFLSKTSPKDVPELVTSTAVTTPNV